MTVFTGLLDAGEELAAVDFLGLPSVDRVFMMVSSSLNEVLWSGSNIVEPKVVVSSVVVLSDGGCHVVENKRPGFRSSWLVWSESWAAYFAGGV